MTINQTVAIAKQIASKPIFRKKDLSDWNLTFDEFRRIWNLACWIRGEYENYIPYSN